MPAAIPIIAAVGGALVANAGSKKAASIGAGASDRATATQEAQYQQTREDQLKQYAQVRADQKPYRDAAYPSLANLSKGLQAGGQYSRNFGMSDFQADPGYQFRVQQGEQGINRAASARGGQYSGATLKALARFNQDIGSQEYGNAYSRFNTDRTTQFNRNATLAGIGQTANTAVGNAGNAAYGTIASAGQNNANQQAQSIQNAGEARASGYVGVSNAIGSGIKQLYNGYQQQQALNSANNNNYNSWVSSNSNSGLSNSDLQSAF